MRNVIEYYYYRFSRDYKVS